MSGPELYTSNYNMLYVAVFGGGGGGWGGERKKSGKSHGSSRLNKTLTDCCQGSKMLTHTILLPSNPVAIQTLT